MAGAENGVIIFSRTLPELDGMWIFPSILAVVALGVLLYYIFKNGRPKK